MTNIENSEDLSGKIDIKPCPFCGCDEIIETEGESYRWVKMLCYGCGASCGDVRRLFADSEKTTKLVIAEWNKRV